jgi:MFS family permease
MAEATATRVDGPLGRAYLEVTLAVLALVTIVAFEAMAVSTAMPAVARDLDAVRSYGFAFSVMLTAQLLGIVLAGVWSDRSGPMVGAVTGQVLLAAGAAMCGFATNLPLFLAGRALTGLGGGLLVVMLYVIAGRVYPEAIRPRLFTYVSAAWVLPSLLGPPVSAWLTTNLSWRWVFWGVVPPVLITLAALTHARSRIDDSTLTEAVSSRDHSAHVRIAWAGLGIALSAGALQLGTYELVLKISPRTGLAVLGLVGIALTAPMLVPPGTWRMARGLPSVMLARALFVGAFYASITYVPLFLVGQRGLTLQMAGLALAVGAIGWAAGAWYQGHDHLHLPRYRLVEVGALLLAVGLAVLSAVAWLGLAWWIVPATLVVSGVAMGLGVTTTTVLALELSPVEEHGAASSSLQLADVLGSVIGIAAATAAFAAWHVPGQDDALFGAIFLGLALVAALAVPAGQRIRS